MMLGALKSTKKPKILLVGKETRKKLKVVFMKVFICLFCTWRGHKLTLKHLADYVQGGRPTRPYCLVYAWLGDSQKTHVQLLRNLRYRSMGSGPRICPSSWIQTFNGSILRQVYDPRCQNTTRLGLWNSYQCIGNPIQDQGALHFAILRKENL